MSAKLSLQELIYQTAESNIEKNVKTVLDSRLREALPFDLRFSIFLKYQNAISAFRQIRLNLSSRVRNSFPLNTL